MHKQVYILAVTAVLLLTSCKGTKSVVGNGSHSNLGLSQVMQLHQQAEPNFNTLASRVQVVYDDGEKNQSITVSLRMEKNETIWIKASILGITLAKAIITPERVSYYETISNTYFDGDFSLISDWLGTDLDFEQVQAILLGQSIFSFKDGKYEVSNTQNSYKIQPKKQPYNFIHSLFLNAENFKVASGSLSQPNEDRLFSLRYGDYQMVDGGFYPSDITIDASEKDEKTKISVTYKKIDVNAPVSFPFSIPEGYEQIRLSK
ncbi:MAG: deoxyuridine 5'-triphosphate nucleotidohydrolase [Alteromonas sp.]|nr:deoxyuridine 5'-triphosphate nucleotidohydrolase [Alteromonas sp.]